MSADPCASCEHKRGRNNKNPGKLIPGRPGKCIRPGGLCDEVTGAGSNEPFPPIPGDVDVVGMIGGPCLPDLADNNGDCEFGVQWPVPYEDEVADEASRIFALCCDGLFEEQLTRILPRLSDMAGAAYWTVLQQANALRAKVSRLKAQVHELRRQALSGNHLIFDLCEELPNLVADAINDGADKVRQDTDAQEFVVTAKIKGKVNPDGRTRHRLVLNTTVSTIVKSELFKETDHAVVPMDSFGVVIPKSEAWKATPLGQAAAPSGGW